MEEIILKEREVREQIVQIINKSGLPAVMLKPIFKDFFETLNNAEAQQYEQARKLKEEKEKKKDKKEEK